MTTPENTASPVAAERPKWVKVIHAFLVDGIIDDEFEYPMDGSQDFILDEIERVVNEVMCRQFGHEIEDDMCMKPEHRYCVWCRRREPDIIAARSAAEQLGSAAST